MIASEHDSDSHDHAEHEADDKAETGRVPDGTLAQVENSGRLVLVHTLICIVASGAQLAE